MIPGYSRNPCTFKGSHLVIWGEIVPGSYNLLSWTVFQSSGPKLVITGVPDRFKIAKVGFQTAKTHSSQLPDPAQSDSKFGVGSHVLFHIRDSSTSQNQQTTACGRCEGQQ
jgi:hypothetical protein